MTLFLGFLSFRIVIFWTIDLSDLSDLSDLLLRITRNMLAPSHTRLARQQVVMEASTRALVLVALAVESVL